MCMVHIIKCDQKNICLIKIIKREFWELSVPLTDGRSSRQVSSVLISKYLSVFVTHGDDKAWDWVGI